MGPTRLGWAKLDAHHPRHGLRTPTPLKREVSDRGIRRPGELGCAAAAEVVEAKVRWDQLPVPGSLHDPLGEVLFGSGLAVGFRQESLLALGGLGTPPDSAGGIEELDGSVSVRRHGPTDPPRGHT